MVDIHMGFASVLFGLLLIIFVHEIGHAMCARYFGVGVKTVSIGFLTAYSCVLPRCGVNLKIGALPIGGYILLKSRRLAVDKQDSNMDAGGLCIEDISVLGRVVIFSGGLIANIIFGFVCMFAASVMEVRDAGAMLGSVAQSSAASVVGAKAGDYFFVGEEIVSDQFDMEKMCRLGMSKSIYIGERDSPGVYINVPAAKKKVVDYSLLCNDEKSIPDLEGFGVSLVAANMSGAKLGFESSVRILANAFYGVYRFFADFISAELKIVWALFGGGEGALVVNVSPPKDVRMAIDYMLDKSANGSASLASFVFGVGILNFLFAALNSVPFAPSDGAHIFKEAVAVCGSWAGRISGFVFGFVTYFLAFGFVAYEVAPILMALYFYFV
ncbi:MAG: M50 family metallopeptidase [Chitinivorax sp.]